jgi:hypothetical protein
MRRAVDGGSRQPEQGSHISAYRSRQWAGGEVRQVALHMLLIAARARAKWVAWQCQHGVAEARPSGGCTCAR